MERREFLGWLGSASVAAMTLASGARDAMGQSGGGAAKPSETAAPPAAAPPADAPPGPDALDLASIAKRRYGAHLTPEQVEELTRTLDRGLQSSSALRKAKLANGDEPDFTFSP